MHGGGGGTECLTLEAVVRCIEVRSELARTCVLRRRGDDVLESLVGYVEFTGAPTGAPAVQVAQDVDAAADVAVVGAHTAADRHAAVPGLGHHDYLAVRTYRLELLSVAYLTRVYTTSASSTHVTGMLLTFICIWIYINMKGVNCNRIIGKLTN